MGQYRKKPVVVEAITFDELVSHGKNTGAPLHDGMPWSFDYKGHPITHENDDCYLIPTLEGTMKMGRSDMLITGVKGEIYPCKSDIFAATYESADRTMPGQPGGVAESFERVLSLTRSSFMEHGLCEPVERNACTACHARRELKRIVDGWKGCTIRLAPATSTGTG